MIKKEVLKTGSELTGRCGAYVGVSCVDGSCPIACSDIYQDLGMDVIHKCEDCWCYNGCSDCALYGTELCLDAEQSSGREVLHE